MRILTVTGPPPAGQRALRRLFEIPAGPVATRAQTSSFYRGLRVVAIDGTTFGMKLPLGLGHLETGT
ncbi:hypothetical protein ABZ667_42170 [Streptomyces lavendulae]|uniref:hypothetical protein n=1 Tax=Streptomyces lavendulae TaxID=1914 RepID=UPI0033EEFC20